MLRFTKTGDNVSFVYEDKTFTFTLEQARMIYAALPDLENILETYKKER